MMRVRLLQALMVDGRDRAAGEVVSLDDATAGEWIGQGLAAPAPDAGRETGVERAAERAVVEPGRRADGPAQAKPSKRSTRAGGS